MQPEEDDEWTVVGRNNRPKRPRAAKPAAADPPAAPLDAAAATARLLPGWGRAGDGGHKRPSPTMTAGGAKEGEDSQQQKHAQHQRPARRREREEATRRTGRVGSGSGSEDDDDDRSRERRCALHAGLVREAAAEVRRSAMFQSLRAAMRSAGNAQEEEEEERMGEEEQQQQQQPPSSLGGSGGFPWASVSELVVYGLGSVESSRVSRHQAALATLLADLLPRVAEAAAASASASAAAAAGAAAANAGSPNDDEDEDNKGSHTHNLQTGGGVVAYDPCFSRVDRRVLRTRLGWSLPTHDERCARRAARPAALFYLPHLEAPLTDALLAANWTRPRLRRMAILGNAFSRYAERWPASRVEAAAEGAWSGGQQREQQQHHGPPRRLLALVAAGAVAERPVREGGYAVASAFNDAALHTFCEASDAAFEAAGVPEEEEEED
jgi:hypothetical protein